MREKSKNTTKAWEINDVIVEHGSRVHCVARSDWSDKDCIAEFRRSEDPTDVWEKLGP